MPESMAPVARHPRGLSMSGLSGLLQFHAWPDRFGEMAKQVSNYYRAPEPPAGGRSVQCEAGSLLRVHPQRLWFVADRDPSPSQQELPPDVGATLDLTHARVLIHAASDLAEPLLSRFVSVDLRPQHFPAKAVALAPLHRVSVLLQRRPDGIGILVPRSFSASLWDILAETAAQLQ